MGYAFISYSSKQQKDADCLKQLLQTNEIDTWMAPFDIPEGAEYADVVNDTIKNAACFVLLLTEDTQDSVYVDKEVERALHYGKTIAPIQLDYVTLNDSFSFYLCNQQIVTVSAIDDSSKKMKDMLRHLQFLCNDRLPEKEVAMDAARDKRTTRQGLSKLFISFGVALFVISLICGHEYVELSSKAMHYELYGNKFVSELSEIVWSFLGFILMAFVAVLAYLYGYGLRDIQKKSWNPVWVLPVRLILPAFSVFCGASSVLLCFLRQSVEIYFFTMDNGSYAMPQWVMPVTWVFAFTGVVTGLFSLVLALIHDKRNGFAFFQSLHNKFRVIVNGWKRGSK